MAIKRYWNKKTAATVEVAKPKSQAEIERQADWTTTKPQGVLFFNTTKNIAREVFGSDNVSKMDKCPEWVRNKNVNVSKAIEAVTAKILEGKNKAAFERAKAKLDAGKDISDLTELEQRVWANSGADI